MYRIMIKDKFCKNSPRAANFGTDTGTAILFDSCKFDIRFHTLGFLMNFNRICR